MSATGSPAGNPAPPASALIVLNGKTEAEMAALVPKLVKAVKVTAAQKRKVEIKAAELENENEQLKAALQPPAPQPPKEKFSWMGFTAS